MGQEVIKSYFTKLKADDKFDAEFVELLSNSYTQNESGEMTAEKAIELIEKRYVESKENKA